MVCDMFPTMMYSERQKTIKHLMEFISKSFASVAWFVCDNYFTIFMDSFVNTSELGHQFDILILRDMTKAKHGDFALYVSFNVQCRIYEGKKYARDAPNMRS